VDGRVVEVDGGQHASYQQGFTGERVERYLGEKKQKKMGDTYGAVEEERVDWDI